MASDSYAFWKNGAQFRVIKKGAYLSGMQPISGGYSSCRIPLVIGTVIKCNGLRPGWGSDSIAQITFDAPEGHSASFCTFHPSSGSFWSEFPDASYLEPAISNA